MILNSIFLVCFLIKKRLKSQDLEQNLIVNLWLHMLNYKLKSLWTFRVSQWQDGVSVLKRYKWGCQGIKRRFREKKTLKKILTDILKEKSENWKLKPKFML